MVVDLDYPPPPSKTSYEILIFSATRGDPNMANLKPYTGDATIQIMEDGKLILKTIQVYPSLEAAGITASVTAIAAAFNSPLPITFQSPIDNREIDWRIQ